MVAILDHRAVGPLHLLCAQVSTRPPRKLQKTRKEYLLLSGNSVISEICVWNRGLTTCMALVFWELLSLERLTVADGPSAGQVWSFDVKSHSPRQVERQPHLTRVRHGQRGGLAMRWGAGGKVPTVCLVSTAQRLWKDIDASLGERASPAAPCGLALGKSRHRSEPLLPCWLPRQADNSRSQGSVHTCQCPHSLLRGCV